MARQSFLVTDALAGQRADALVRRLLPGLPEQEKRAVFARRDVKLDGVRIRPDTRASAGQLLEVFYVDHSLSALPIVYRDRDILLLNKPAGISTQDDIPGLPSLEAQARAWAEANAPGSFAPRPCHRLDNQTSGLILFALNQRAYEVLRQAFEERTLEKTYTCLVRGQPKPPEAVCRAWLVKDAQEARVRVLDREVRGARPIVTAYETLSAGAVSRLRVHLITGRTHQIRAHMAALGHPLLGDDVYGDRALNRAMRVQGKLRLCATSLTLHTGGALPQLDGKVFTIECPF